MRLAPGQQTVSNLHKRLKSCLKSPLIQPALQRHCFPPFSTQGSLNISKIQTTGVGGTRKKQKHASDRILLSTYLVFSRHPILVLNDWDLRSDRMEDICGKSSTQ